MYKVSGNLISAYGSELDSSSAPVKKNGGPDMPHVTSNSRRMTNIPIGNGEYVQGIRKNTGLGDDSSKLPDLTPPHGMKPLRYTAGLACDPELERLRPERDNKHQPFQGGDQQQWKKKLIQHPGTYDGSFVDADMQQFRPVPSQHATQDPWYASRIPDGQYYPANERLAGPATLPNMQVNPYDQIYPQDELARIKERNRRFANNCGQDGGQMSPGGPMPNYSGFGGPQMAPQMSMMMPGHHMPMMQPMMQPHPMMAPQQGYYGGFNQPTYALPPPMSQMDELRLLDQELDSTRRVTRPFVPQGDAHFADLQQQRNNLEETTMSMQPVVRRPMEIPTSIDQLPSPKKNLVPKRNENADDQPKPRARHPEVRIADQIAIRSIVLGKELPSIGNSRAESRLGSESGIRSPRSGRNSAVVSPSGSNGGIRSPVKFPSVSENNDIAEEE